jgi:superoxide dismutase, Cu-Zn family
MRAILVLAGFSTLALGACTQSEDVAVGSPTAGGARATAMLKTATGMDVGRATATDVAGGIRYTLDVKNMPAGMHGAHIHTIGRCDGPDFTTAGGHWNPTTMKHGSMNPQGPHEGDLPNLTVGSDGRGTLGVVVPGATIAGLLDADGAAIVVHAGPDDLMSDPAGNSGGRIACGVFTAA